MTIVITHYGYFSLEE